MNSLDWLQIEKLERTRRILNDPAIQHALEVHRKVQCAIDQPRLRHLLDEQRRWSELQQTISPLLSRMEWRQWQLLELPNLLRDQAFRERQNWWNSPGAVSA